MRRVILSFSVMLLVPFSALAQITTYDFTGAPGNQASTAASGVATGLTASVLNRGTGVTASAGGSSIAATGWSLGALDLNDYFEFTLTPDPSFILDVDSIVFSERRSGTGIRDMAVRSSLDGFTANLFTATVPDDTLTRRQTATLGVAFDTLVAPVTFRIYGFTAEAAAGSWRIGISTTAGENPGGFPANLLVNGTVTAAVPEPTSLAIFGLAIGGVAARLWTRRRNQMLAEPRTEEE